MNIEHARELVAQCWCDPRAKNMVMDPVLAEIFAEMILDKTTNLRKHVEDQSQTITRLLEGNHKIAAAGQDVSLRLIEASQRESDLIDQLVKLHDAADALYMAGRWILPNDSGDGWDQAKLWEDLRSTLGYEPGHSTEAGVNTVEEAADPDVALVAGKTYTCHGDGDVPTDSYEEETEAEAEALNERLETIIDYLEKIEWNTQRVL